MQGDRDPSYDHRRMFDRHVEELMAKGKLRMAMNRDTINQKIQRLLQLEAGAGKVCQDDYRLSKLYSVVNFGDGVSVLVKKIEKGPEIDVHAMERFVPIEDYFDNLLSIHADGVGHGGRDRMLKRINEMKLANLPRELVQAFVSFCPQCAKKKPRPNAGIVIKPILSKAWAQRMQCDLMDFQSCVFGGFKYILNLQDHMTKFLVLRPLKNKKAATVAAELVDIFSLIGPPAILHSDNGTEFVAQVVKQLKDIWPGLEMVHGKPRHPQTQGSVERSNGDVKDMLTAWMNDHKSKDWPLGLKFVQLSKNSALNRGSGSSPYELAFGEPPRIGLSTSPIPKELLDKISTEEELQGIVQIKDEVVGPGHSSDTLSDLDFIDAGKIKESQPTLAVKRAAAQDKQARQAETMMATTYKKLKRGDVHIGQNVLVPIADVDRAKVDHRNLLGVVTALESEDGVRIRTRHGALDGIFFRNQYTVAPQKFLRIGDTSAQPKLSVRQAAKLESIVGGQGMTKCFCAAGGARCRTSVCTCWRLQRQCNSRCHPNLMCHNKKE